MNEADLPNTINRNFNGYAPRTHIVSGLAYARIGGRFHYVCLLADLSNGEAVGHSAGLHKNAGLVKAAFATIPFALADIEAFHTGGGWNRRCGNRRIAGSVRDGTFAFQEGEPVR